MSLGSSQLAAEQPQPLTNTEPQSISGDCASDGSRETDYGEGEEEGVAVEELYQEYIKRETASEYGGGTDDMFLDHIQGAVDQIGVDANVDGKVIEKEEAGDANHMYQQVNSQSIPSLDSAGLCIKREEGAWSSPGVKRRIYLGIEDLPDYKSPRLEVKQENAKTEQKVNVLDPMSTTLEYDLHSSHMGNIPQYKEIFLGAAKDDVRV